MNSIDWIWILIAMAIIIGAWLFFAYSNEYDPKKNAPENKRDQELHQWGMYILIGGFIAGILYLFYGNQYQKAMMGGTIQQCNSSIGNRAGVCRMLDEDGKARWAYYNHGPRKCVQKCNLHPKLCNSCTVDAM